MCASVFSPNLLRPDLLLEAVRCVARSNQNLDGAALATFPAMRKSLAHSLWTHGTLLFASLIISCGNPENSDGQTKDDEKEPSICGAHAKAAGWVPGEAPPPQAESSAERIASLGRETWDLSLELLRAVPDLEAENIAHSAVSFYVSLGMTYSRFEDHPCGESIAQVMNFPELGRDLHETIGATVRLLEEKSLPEEIHQAAVDVSLEQTRWFFSPAVAPESTDIEKLYGAAIHTVKERGDAARNLINCVVEEQSKGLISNFLPQGAINADAEQLDLNVTYLSAPWDIMMAPRVVEFTPEGGTASEVAGFGSEPAYLQYHAGSTFDAISLPLRGMLKVLILLPHREATGSLSELTSEIESESLFEATSSLESRFVHFRMPKINIPSQSIDYYERLGLECGPYTVQTAVQAAAIQIDEFGVKAAAATDGGDGDGDGDEPDEFYVDRPFLFFIYDPETKVVLFSARVMDVAQN